MPEALIIPAKPAGVAQRALRLLRSAYEYLVLYLGLLLFALPLFIWSQLAVLLFHVLPARTGRSVGQSVLTMMFRAYLFALKATGLVKLDLSALDALRDERSLIIAPNHPCLLDAVLVVSRLPRVVCIMKSELGENAIFGGGSRLAQYISNNSSLGLVRSASAAVRAGSQLLVFPEGTRTRQGSVNGFRPGFALIARKAGVPVQTVFIETNSRFLGKGWPIFRKPVFPLVYRARLGERFDVDADIRSFVADLEDYYRESLGNAMTAS
jgi:1-acyl-sn-glycerol-3-phosphate acyltransferase